MAIYGDEVRQMAGFKTDPIKAIAKAVTGIKTKVNAEQDEMVAEALKECTDDPKKDVSILFGEEKWDRRELTGCNADSTCSLRVKNLTAVGRQQAICMTTEGRTIKMHTQKLNKAQDEHRSASSALSELQTKRKEMNQKFIENLENHQKADDVLSNIIRMLGRNESNADSSVEDNA